eukprot:9284708-Pyramimonas_sp.AAC.1
MWHRQRATTKTIHQSSGSGDGTNMLLFNMPGGDWAVAGTRGAGGAGDALAAGDSSGAAGDAATSEAGVAAGDGGSA